MINRFLDYLDGAISFIAIAIGWLGLFALCGFRVYEVIARQYIDSIPSELLRYLETIAFILLVTMALGYAYLRDSHVRVDILRARFKPHTQAWIEVAGVIFVVLPLVTAVAVLYVPFVYDTYLAGLSSVIFLGAPMRWVIESIIPLGFVLLGLASLIVLARNFMYLAGHKKNSSSLEPQPDVTLRAQPPEAS